MIIQNQAELTQAVLSEVARTPDPRLRRILAAAVQHLHDFVRETELTEPEFRKICAVIAQCGQLTTPSHNEVVLAAGSLGVSALVCQLNNSLGGTSETTANLMGPFWRQGSPLTANGGSIVRSQTPGEPVFVKAWVQDESGEPVAGAEVDIWQASGEGYYENQDPQQADMNLRGKFVTDAQGCVEFRTVKPSGYPIPVTGPVQDYLVNLAASTRSHRDIPLGVSPRGLLTWQRTAQAWAYLAGRQFVTPDDVQQVAVPVLSVRLGTERGDTESLIRQLLQGVEAPTWS